MGEILYRACAGDVIRLGVGTHTQSLAERSKLDSTYINPIKAHQLIRGNPALQAALEKAWADVVDCQ